METLSTEGEQPSELLVPDGGPSPLSLRPKCGTNRLGGYRAERPTQTRQRPAWRSGLAHCLPVTGRGKSSAGSNPALGAFPGALLPSENSELSYPQKIRLALFFPGGALLPSKNTTRRTHGTPKSGLAHPWDPEIRAGRVLRPRRRAAAAPKHIPAGAAAAPDPRFSPPH